MRRVICLIFVFFALLQNVTLDCILNCGSGPNSNIEICGVSVRNLNNKQTFNNLCELLKYNLEHLLDVYVPYGSGECSTCPSFCPETPNEICALTRTGFFRTFTNKCLFDKYNCENPNAYQYASPGRCATEKPCPSTCPPQTSICCVSGQTGLFYTFGGQCLLDKYNCNHPNREYHKALNGVCPPTLPQQPPPN